MEEILVLFLIYFIICDKCSKNFLYFLYLFLIIKGDSFFFLLFRRGLFFCWYVCVIFIDIKMIVSMKLLKKLLVWGNFYECEIMGIKSDEKVFLIVWKLLGFL